MLFNLYTKIISLQISLVGKVYYFLIFQLVVFSPRSEPIGSVYQLAVLEFLFQLVVFRLNSEPTIIKRKSLSKRTQAEKGKRDY